MQGPLPVPRLDWIDGTPRAPAFDDIYFNPVDGLAEARHVFLQGTGMPKAWSGRRDFVIGETGFGTGLNFLAACQLWLSSRPANGRLHFISVEGAPLSVKQLERAHAAFAELGGLALRLREIYPPRARGHHTLHFSDDISLQLLFGEAREMLSGLEAHVDAWFLDGFAPSRNPEMWTPEIMTEIARCSNESAQLASFTVAGDVRRALCGAGFEVEKAPGFGRKRHMLMARYRRPRPADAAPWFAAPPPARGNRVAIIGAGIAGVSAARAFSGTGFCPVLIEAGPAFGSGASGAPSGLVMPRLSADADAPALFYANAHRWAVGAYGPTGLFSREGALHLPPKADQVGRLEKMSQTGLFDPARIGLLSPEDATRKAGTTIASPALYFADAGVLDAAAYLAGAAGDLETRFKCPIANITRVNDEWQLVGESGEVCFIADIVIVAAGMASGRLLAAARLPLEARNGQITKLTGAEVRLPIAYGGYVVPNADGIWLGATHVPSSSNEILQLDSQADEENLANLCAALPELGAHAKVAGSWAGTRATTPDFLPLAGALCDAATYLREFADYAKGMRHGLPNPSYAPGLYVIAGLSSRGFVTAPLLGELIAAEIAGTPLPVEREVAHALHPARFLIRDLRRGTPSADRQSG